jgi:hypothetical protein
MQNKILGFIRETLLHENLVEGLSVDLLAGEVRLNLLQPNPDYHEYPDPELLLTFSGVREFSARDVGPGGRYGEDVLGIECTAEGTLYQAVITVGHPGSASWSIRLVFAGLCYKRSRSDD